MSGSVDNLGPQESSNNLGGNPHHPGIGRGSLIRKKNQRGGRFEVINDQWNGFYQDAGGVQATADNATSSRNRSKMETGKKVSNEDLLS
jgi:hypothetical protein